MADKEKEPQQSSAPPAAPSPSPSPPGLASSAQPGERGEAPTGAAQDLNNTDVAYEPAPLPSPATRALGEAPKVTPGGNPAKPGTTRDGNDLGVPMLPGRGDEPQGPEDALGLGPKRGDYRDRIGPQGYEPHGPRVDAAGNLLAPLEPQRPRADELGDVPGKKGGVQTASEAAG